MGYYADRFSARGKLYLITREDEPFCGEMCILWRRVGRGWRGALIKISEFGKMVEVTIGVGEFSMTETLRTAAYGKWRTMGGGRWTDDGERWTVTVDGEWADGGRWTARTSSGHTVNAR